MTHVVVVTGIGGMGVACAHRLGAGHHLVLADFDEPKVHGVADSLQADGFTVTPHVVDVSDRSSVDALVDAVRGIGPLRTLVHTAGLSPTQASAERVLEVDMLGTDHVLAAFFEIVQEGTVAVCIASMAGSMANLPPDRERALATVATEDLMSELEGVDLGDFGATYSVAKRINQLRASRRR